MAVKEKEPLLHISRRLGITKKKRMGFHALTFVGAFLFCALICILFAKSGSGFIDFFSGLYSAVVTQNVAKPLSAFITTLEEAAILLGIALALLPAFKMKFWNLGAEGQVLMGGLAAAAISKFAGPSLPTAITIILMAVCAALAGAIWSLAPAICKAYFKTNETLFTLMMNYVAMGIISCLVRVWNPAHGTCEGLTYGMFSNVGPYRYIWNILIVLLMLFAMFFYLRFTKHGYELSVVGESVATARYSGINVKKTTIRTVLLSGALCGIVGWLIVAGAAKGIASGSADGRGFTGVLIAWLGNLNPFYMALVAFFSALISRGASNFASIYLKGNASFPKVCLALFFFAILVGEFFLNYEVHLRHKKENTAAVKEAK